MGVSNEGYALIREKKALVSPSGRRVRVMLKSGGREGCSGASSPRTRCGKRGRRASPPHRLQPSTPRAPSADSAAPQPPGGAPRGLPRRPSCRASCRRRRACAAPLLSARGGKRGRGGGLGGRRETAVAVSILGQYATLTSTYRHEVASWAVPASRNSEGGQQRLIALRVPVQPHARRTRSSRRSAVWWLWW
jgi:hypothetical protein